ncbi:hypothetical protein [Microlunatus parietis]|uniref:Uncharacterized protein n=1 Tax=Microlunatus parietis TaxID=682979 RepID=A0A7Y9IBC5_9ACTN|nr:hypothetical protein [Microlunatus parietis]NYE73159.1 hypothetical protein [Microlunatus parietis]
MTAQQTETPGREISGPVADLTAYRTAEELAHISQINAGCIVVRESLAVAAAEIPANVGATITVPDDVAVRIQAGMATLGGDAFAPEEGPNTALVVVGGLIVTEPVRQVTYRQISVVGMILIPRGSESLGGRLTHLIGGARTYEYEEGTQVRSVAGDATLSAAMIANEDGNPKDVLLASGEVLIDEPVETVGYQQVIVSGQLIAPRESRDRFGSKLELAGQGFWYRGANPRVVGGDETYDADFLSLVDEPLSLIVTGKLTFADDVTNELIKKAVADIVLIGTITVPPAGQAAVRLLNRDGGGTIVITGDAPG